MPGCRDDNPTAPPAPLPADRDRVHGRAPGTIAVGVLVENRLDAGLQRRRRRTSRFGRRPSGCRVPLSCPSRPLGDLHRPDRPGVIRPDYIPFTAGRGAPRGPPPNCSTVIPSAPAAPPLLLDLQPRIPHQSLGGCRATCPSASAHARGSSLAVGRTRSPGRPRPFAPQPSPIRGRFTATTSESASAPGDGTQLLADSVAWRSSSRCGRHRSGVWGTPSRVP